MRATTFITLAIMGCLCGCGGGPPSSGDPGDAGLSDAGTGTGDAGANGPGACVVTFTGGFSGAFPCVAGGVGPPVSLFTMVRVEASVPTTADAGAASYDFGFTLTTPQNTALEPASYDDLSAASAVARLTLSSSEDWWAVWGNQTGFKVHGTWALTLSSVTPLAQPVTVAGVFIETTQIHGVASASMVLVSGGTGQDVQVSITF